MTGDTPEYMSLDSNLFSDLETTVRWNVEATLVLDAEDPREFTLCTPGNVWDAITRTWEYAPTEKRIVQDIERVFDAIDLVVEHGGAEIDFVKHRHGRRDHEHRVARRNRVRRERKLFDNLAGLHPISKECIRDLIDLT